MSASKFRNYERKISNCRKQRLSISLIQEMQIKIMRFHVFPYGKTLKDSNPQFG